jgi:hypothetical protein
MRSKSGEPSPKTLLFLGDFFQNIFLKKKAFVGVATHNPNYYYFSFW